MDPSTDVARKTRTDGPNAIKRLGQWAVHGSPPHEHPIGIAAYRETRVLYHADGSNGKGESSRYGPILAPLDAGTPKRRFQGFFQPCKR